MNLAEAHRIYKRKCAEPTCWHWHEPWGVYCQHCLLTGCRTIPSEERELIVAAIQVIDASYKGKEEVTDGNR